MPEPVRITVIGAGYVGLVSGTCLAAQGHRVRLLDLRREAVESIARGVSPIHEAGLAELLSRSIASGALTADLASESAIGDSDVVLVCVGTPSTDGAIDLAQVVGATRLVGRWLADRGRFAAVVIKSTVVPGTTDTVVRGVLEAESGRRLGPDGFGLGMNPEFLREGEAVGDFMAPDRIVLGHEDPGTLALLERLYAPWDCPKLRVNTRTAEMVKYANNCLLALQISAANELANVAAAIGGVDFMDVLEGVTLDRRWSPVEAGGRRVRPGIVSYLVPGCGFGGSCFPKDVAALRTLAGEVGVEPRLLQAVLDVNAGQPAAVLGPLVRALGGDLRGRTILLLGLAFKPGTDDVRESAALPIARLLSAGGARVLAHDPVAAANAAAALGEGVVEIVPDWRAAVDPADAVVVATRWSEYESLADFDAALAGKVVLDARNMFSEDAFRRATRLHVGHAPRRSSS